MPESTVIQRPHRWDNPFDPDMSEKNVDRVLKLAKFSSMDPDAFPASAPLRDIVRNDTRFRTYQDGEVVIRRGDFGTSAYLIVSGNARVVLPPGLPDSVLGRASVRKKGVFKALRQLWENPKMPEARDPVAVSAGVPDARRRSLYEEEGAGSLDSAEIIKNHKTHQFNAGEMFGEIAALARSSRTTTIFAEGEAEILEIRRQGIRDIRRWVDDFRQQIDNLYRVNSVFSHLRQMPLFRHLDDDTMKRVADATLFESYGDFDWHISYNRLIAKSPEDRLAGEPVIVREGDYPDGILMVRSGFARVSRKVNNGERTLKYIGTWSVFGFEEIVHNWQFGDQDPVGLQRTLRAVGYTDVLRVPTSIVEQIVLPNLPKDLTPGKIERRHEAYPPRVERRMHSWTPPSSSLNLDAGLLETVVEYRYINGTAAMMIDLDRCIRCDACVEACAKGHNNNPRFVRHGRVFDHFMIANACMHCVDPVCMLGCPTGAIGRDQQSGQVVINDATCIGCMTCASNCPYDNIRIVEIRDQSGNFILDEATNSPIVKATKCDLCVDQPGGPACQRACPHDALKRVHMGDFPTLANWLSV